MTIRYLIPFQIKFKNIAPSHSSTGSIDSYFPMSGVISFKKITENCLQQEAVGVVCVCVGEWVGAGGEAKS